VAPNTVVNEPRAVTHAPEAPFRAALGAPALVVLTHDAQLIAMLRRVSESLHPVNVVGAQIELSTALMAQPPGVAVLDCAAGAGAMAMLTQQLRTQFPALVLIVVGTADEQGLLAAQITDGSVHRFLHKPFSEQRVKLFVESAWKRHEESDGLPEIHAPARRTQHRRSNAGWWLALLVLTGIAAPLAYFASRPQELAHLKPALHADIGADQALESLLARADQALAQGQLVSPAGNNAVELYRAALAKSANDPRAVNGIEQVIGQLLSGAEAQLQQHQLDAAQQLVEAARAVSPQHPRVAFLAAQIGAQRERAVLAKAQRPATGNAAAPPIAVAQSGEAASTAGPDAPLAAAAPPATVSDYLARGRAALSRGQLIEPLQDNARFYFAAARQLAPQDADVEQAMLDLCARLSSEARQALEAKDAEQAEIWTAAAADAGEDSAQIATLREGITQLRSTASREKLASLAASFNRSLSQGRLLEPATDSARFYLAQLSATDAASEMTQQAKSAYGQRALEEARSALGSQDLTAAQRWLGEARSAGADANETATLASAVSTAQQADSYVSEGSLTRTRYVAPKFPALASEHNISGWVDLQFLIGTDGTVSDASVVGAQPAGVFEQAALDAVRHWRYQPVQHDGTAARQRARVRVRFAVQP